MNPSPTLVQFHRGQTVFVISLPTSPETARIA
jgi:hypothetical protein